MELDPETRKALDENLRHDLNEALKMARGEPSELDQYAEVDDPEVDDDDPDADD